ncbi:MAG: M61 family peptidase [Candidatus Poseidoniales archaeon]|nr:MAG: M61 family peptidase [Candidatus Poseidoniales archaeon]
MRDGYSGLKFLFDATEGDSRHLYVGIELEGPFTGKNLTLSFPRWVPGSYFLREPIQYMFDFEAFDGNGNLLSSNRKDVDSMRINLTESTNLVKIKYKILAIELSCRSTHLDGTHVHVMPPFTWFLPVSGIDSERMEKTHIIKAHIPSHWTPATQYLEISNNDSKGLLTNNSGRTYHFEAPNRDELLDGILEANENETMSWVVEGRTHHLKIWDSGGYVPNKKMLERLKDDMDKVVMEHHALFGIPKWDNYVTVLHFTEKSRGGLEHLNSQTSMLPRQCLMPGFEDEYKDLVSLFSHEYLHQWNVKRLRPRNFLNYDLQKETHSDLLWWFEGATSWLGDVLCVRSGAWSEEDWRKDFLRKMKRHTLRNGMEKESLAESSHDAWIHLYRSHAFSRETQNSYYLEGELAIFCLDAELRKRSKGKSGLCQLMAILCEKHAIHYPETQKLGVTYKDIRSSLTGMEGGLRLGKMLDKLVFERKAPDVDKALQYFSLDLIPEKVSKEGEIESAWMGVQIREVNKQLRVTSHQQNSPLRKILMPGDEIIAINGFRVNSNNLLNKYLKGLVDCDTEITFNHEGIVQTCTVSLPSQPTKNVKLDGKGNKKWKDYIATRQTI